MACKQSEIDRIAEEFLDRYAGEAETIAAGQADTMLDFGDLQRFEFWKKVMAAISRRQRRRAHLFVVCNSLSSD